MVCGGVTGQGGESPRPGAVFSLLRPPSPRPTTVPQQTNPHPRFPLSLPPPQLSSSAPGKLAPGAACRIEGLADLLRWGLSIWGWSKWGRDIILLVISVRYFIVN